MTGSFCLLTFRLHRALRRSLALWLIALVLLAPVISSGETLNITNDVQTLATLTNTTVTMTARAELRITGTGDPIPGCTIHLNSPDA